MRLTVSGIQLNEGQILPIFFYHIIIIIMP